jgi:hypothetical protein
MSHQPDNIFAGTQVVSLVEVRGTNNSLVHPRGAVGVVSLWSNFEQEETETKSLFSLFAPVKHGTRHLRDTTLVYAD